MITAKFGGTSLCDAAHFQMVRDILALKEERRFVVVSAPGKRFPEDIKITDQLYRCHEEARQGGNVAEAFTPVASRFQEIAAQLTPYGFVRCSASYLVNLRCITAVSRMNVYIGGAALPIGRTYKDAFTEAFSRYMAKKEWEDPCRS